MQQREKRERMKYTQEQLTQIFTDAIELFNETMDEEYNIKFL